MYIIRNKRSKWTLTAIVLIVPLGFYSKFYSGPAAGWVNNSLGGVLYVIFWCLLFSLVFYRVKNWKIVTGVFAVTCILEFLQLWHPPFLEAARDTFIGVTLLGNSFSWPDLAYYLAGSLMAWGLLVLLLGKESSREKHRAQD
jgi:ascorbate-specific PTS system EIIC-type component UlaA